MEFNYQAKTQGGSLLEGKIEAPTEDQAVNILHQKDLIILYLEPISKALFSRDILSVLKRVKNKDIVIFTRQLATLVDADVPLIEGLYTLSQQSENDVFRKTIINVAKSIEGGSSLSVALAEYEIFSQFYISLVKAGEASGKLHATLNYLADYMEKSAGLTSKIKSALAYPMFIVGAIVLVSFIVVVFVLPQLLSILKDSGIQDLPLSTKILIAVTGFINNYIIFILILLIGAVMGVIYYTKSEQGIEKWDGMKLNLPQFGALIKNFYLARLGETLATLIRSGVPILDSLKITSEVVGNAVYKKILVEAIDNVKSGGTMSETFSRYKAFPPLVSSMLSIGEKTGRTDFMLDNFSKFYKNEAENGIQNLTQLIEPILILLLGLGVGVLVSAILLPIYSLVGAS